MKFTILVTFLFTFLFTACTTTYVKRTDGQKTFEAGNTSIGWERENLKIDVLKGEKETAIQIGLGKSSGAKSLEKAIESMENAISTLKALRP